MPISLLLTLLLAQAGNPQPVTGAKGMVVCDEPIAAKIGAEILAKGGNAVDAAIAVAFALAVVEPTAGNIGGGGFMLVRLATGRTAFIDYRETAPSAASHTMYATNAKQSTEGLKASGVPGTVAGMAEAMRRFGSRSWKELVEPSAKLAKEGFTISRSQAAALEKEAKRLTVYANTRRTYLRDGVFYRPSDTVKLPELAATLQRLADGGPQEFYRGETAKIISQDMAARGGLVTRKDLEGYKPKVREALSGTYHGYQILTAPLPSSGGVCLLEMLNILEPYKPSDYPFLSSRRCHLLVEAMKLAFADRAALLGDPDFVRVPVPELTSKAYAESQRNRIRINRATPSSEIGSGLRPIEKEHTTHFSVVDAAGNIVSNTYTLNDSFGCGDMILGGGFLMNNEMDDFAANPGKPNLFGLVQGERNAIEPGKRPLSSMCPTIVLKDGKPLLVLGSPGGPRIINTVLQVLLNVLDHGMTLAQAVQAPRIHHQWLPDETSYEEPWFSMDTLDVLTRMGHKLKPAKAIGIANCIAIDSKTGLRQGMPDKRYSDATAAAQ